LQWPHQGAKNLMKTCVLWRVAAMACELRARRAGPQSLRASRFRAARARSVCAWCGAGTRTCARYKNACMRAADAAGHALVLGEVVVVVRREHGGMRRRREGEEEGGGLHRCDCEHVGWIFMEMLHAEEISSA